jgi:transcriptional regulator with XRE-family HTH domain
MPGRAVDPRFAQRMRELLDHRGMSLRALAAHTYYSKSYLGELATGHKRPTVDAARRIDEALSAGGELAALVHLAPAVSNQDGELDALDLARRITASDVGADVLDRLETAVDDLACAYSTTQPGDLLPRAGRHLAYVGQLFDARKTLGQHRRLLIVGGWLSLLTATLSIDLRQRAAADAYLTTARRMAEQANHAEILAWCVETEAWDVLTSGQYAQAAKLSRQAQSLAPRGSSVLIQATAQEGRAWARMGRSAETLDALRRASVLTASLAVPDRPEHHYRYDPAKADSYTATTLAWVGDPAAEDYARAVLRAVRHSGEDVRRPRRAASARLDLSLALLAADKPDEAAAVATEAITSGRVVPSNWWRAAEIMSAVHQLGVAESAELDDAYHTFRPNVTA